MPNLQGSNRAPGRRIPGYRSINRPPGSNPENGVMSELPTIRPEPLRRNFEHGHSRANLCVGSSLLKLERSAVGRALKPSIWIESFRLTALDAYSELTGWVDGVL